MDRGVNQAQEGRNDEKQQSVEGPEASVHHLRMLRWLVLQEHSQEDDEGTCSRSATGSHTCWPSLALVTLVASSFRKGKQITALTRGRRMF